MKIDGDVAIRNLANEPIKGDDGKELTLSGVVCNALLFLHQDDSRESGEQKAEKFKLAMRLYDGGEQEVSVEEAATIKKMVARLYGPLVVGRVFELIENSPSAPATSGKVQKLRQN